MKYIFIVGAPGSRWSGVARSIYYSDQIDQSDDTPERIYFNPKSPPKAKQLMHRGAYFDPGMEFGKELEDFDSLSKQDLEKIFDAPFEGSDKIKIIKSHVLSKHVDKLAELFDDPIVLVYRYDQDCFDWWKQAGGWEITYPNYQWYKDDATMQTEIANQNKAIRKYVLENKLYSINNNIDLQKILGIKSMNYSRFTDVEVYCKINNESKNS
mgnify:CR=1 FL=1